MERLIESSVVLSDAAFGQSLQKVVFNTRKSFEHFRSAIDTCKAIFKSKSYDGKEKFYALLILKEVTRVAQDAQFDYFVDKAAKRMKDFAIFNRKAPINVRGETCLDEFKKGTNKTWSQRFFELNLECWSSWVAQAQNLHESKKAKKLVGFAETIRDYGVQLPQTTVHFGLFKIDEQGQLEGQQSQTPRSDGQAGQGSAQVPQPQPISAPRPPQAPASPTPAQGVSAANRGGQEPVAAQASPAEQKMLQQAREASVMLQENFNMVGMSDTFEDYMNDLFAHWETQDPTVAIAASMKQVALTQEGRRILESVVQSARESKRAFEGFSRGQMPFDQLKQTLKKHADDAKAAVSGRPQQSQPPQAQTQTQRPQTQQAQQQQTQNSASYPNTAAAPAAGWGTGFSGGGGFGGSDSASLGFGVEKTVGRTAAAAKRAFEDEDEEFDGFIRVPGEEAGGEGEFGGRRPAAKVAVDDKDIWGEDSGDDKEDLKQDYPAKLGQNPGKVTEPALPGAQMLDDEGFDWGDADKEEEPPKRTLDWVFEQTASFKTPDAANPKEASRAIQGGNQASIVSPNPRTPSTVGGGPAKHHQPKHSFGVSREELEDSEFMDQKGTVMTEEEKVKLALKNQDIISKPESQQQLNNFFSQPDAPKGPEDVFAKAKRLREAKLQPKQQVVDGTKQAPISSQRSSLGTKKGAAPLNASSANSVAGSKREPGSPGASVQSIQLKPKPITGKNDSGLKESDLFGEETFSHRGPYESPAPPQPQRTATNPSSPPQGFDPFGGTAVFAQPNEQTDTNNPQDWFGGSQRADEQGFGAFQEEDDVFAPHTTSDGPRHAGGHMRTPIPEEEGTSEEMRSEQRRKVPAPVVMSRTHLRPGHPATQGGNGFTEFPEEEDDQPEQERADAFSFKKQGTRGSQFGAVQDQKTLNESDFFSAGILDGDAKGSRSRGGNLGMDYSIRQQPSSGQSKLASQQNKPDVETMELQLKVKELEVTVDSLRSQLHQTYEALVAVQAETKFAEHTDTGLQAKLLQQLEHQLELEKHERSLYEDKYNELNQRLQLERESTSELHRAFDPKRLIELSKLNDTLLEEKSQMARELVEEKEKSRHLDFFRSELHKTKAELNEVTKMYLAQTTEMSRLQVDKAHIEESVLKELSVLHATQRPKENVNIQTDEYTPEPPEWMKRVTALMDPEGDILNLEKHGPDHKANSKSDISQMQDLEKDNFRHSQHQNHGQPPLENEFQSHQSNGFGPDHHQNRDSLPGFSPYGVTINGHRPGAQPTSPHFNNSVNESFCQEFLTMFNTAIDTLASRNPTPPPKAQYNHQKAYTVQEPERRPSEPVRQTQQQAEPFLFEKFGNLYTTTQIPFPSHTRSGSDMRQRQGSITPTYQAKDWVTHGWNNTPRSSASIVGADLGRPLQSPTGLGSWRF